MILVPPSEAALVSPLLRAPGFGRENPQAITGVKVWMVERIQKPDDVLLINAAHHVVKRKPHNQLTDEHID